MTTTNTTTEHTLAQLEALALDAERAADHYADYDGMRDTFTRIAIAWWGQIVCDTRDHEQKAYAQERIAVLRAVVNG